MQRILLVLIALLVTPLAAWAQDEADVPPQKDLLRDTQQCTEAVNAEVIATADGEVDAEALFVECMTQRGYTEDELDEMEEQ